MISDRGPTAHVLIFSKPDGTKAFQTCYPVRELTLIKEYEQKGWSLYACYTEDMLGRAPACIRKAH